MVEDRVTHKMLMVRVMHANAVDAQVDVYYTVVTLFIKSMHVGIESQKSNYNKTAPSPSLILVPNLQC